MIYRIRTWLPKCLWHVRRLQIPVQRSEVANPPDDGRKRLPNRRMAVRQRMKWLDSQGNDHIAEVSFGFDPQGAIREVFCLASKEGSDMQGIVHDACIAISIALQRGARVRELAKSFGELRDEGQKTGRPASIMGALVRLGAAIEIKTAEIDG